MLVTPTELWSGRDFTERLSPPPPFKVRLDPAVLHVRAGVIDEPHHPRNGDTVYVSRRGSRDPLAVHIEIAPSADDRYLSGYARLRSGRTALARPRSVGRADCGSGPARQLLDLWASQGHRRRVTHGEAEVASLGSHYKIRLPEPFRDYLLHACSTLDDGGDMDGFTNAWWGLERIRSLREECGQWPMSEPVFAANADTILLFADTLIWCAAWGVFCGEGPDFGRVFRVGGPARIVADSFDEFVDRYVVNDQEVY